MGAPLFIVNETKREYIKVTGSRVYESSLAYLLSLTNSLLQQERWSRTDGIFTCLMIEEELDALTDYQEIFELESYCWTQPIKKTECPVGLDRYYVDFDLPIPPSPNSSS